MWHYTIRDFFAGIVRDREIKPSAAFAGGQARPTVWFSTNADWEPMAAKNLTCIDGSQRLLNRDELHTIGITPIRIRVAPEIAPHTWHDFKRDGDLPAKVAGNIVALATRLSSKPSGWFATYQVVPRRQWLAVEHFDGWQWKVLPEEFWMG